MDCSKKWMVFLSKAEFRAPNWMVRREEALECVELQAGLDWKVVMVLVENREVDGFPRGMVELMRSRCETRCSRSGKYLKRCWTGPLMAVLI